MGGAGVLDFAALDALTGGSFGVFDVPCLLCSEGRKRANRTRPVLRVWQDDETFIRYRCAHCGAQGSAHADKRSRATSPSRPTLPARRAPDDTERTQSALRIWNEAHPASGTPIMTYLAKRRVKLPHGCTDVGWHPSCPYGKGFNAGCMVALVRNIVTNEKQAIHRTPLSHDGRKLKVGEEAARKSFGPVSGGAIKLSPDDDVESCLGVGEGIETALSLREHPAFASIPVWSLVSKGGFETFPVLPGLEGLVIAVDNDPAGIKAAGALADRYEAAGVAVTMVKAPAEGADLNDLVRGAP
jgi:hypothetical protein